jgi:DhnA family fructose-bisphosphate aldolase class Ia
MGRNIWGHKNPQKMTAAVVAIVHHGASVDEALAMLA